MEKEIYVHKNPHGKSRLSTKGRIHPDGVKYIRADVVEEQLRQVKNLGLFSVSQRSELLAFKQFISKTPQAELEYYSDEEFTDLYLKDNCG